LGFARAFGLFWITPSMALLNVTSSDSVAGDDLCQHTHGRADLRRAAFISEQTRQNFRANIFLRLESTRR
jgi:hypothetical protein